MAIIFTTRMFKTYLLWIVLHHPLSPQIEMQNTVISYIHTTTICQYLPDLCLPFVSKPADEIPDNFLLTDETSCYKSTVSSSRGEFTDFSASMFSLRFSVCLIASSLSLSAATFNCAVFIVKASALTHSLQSAAAATGL